MSKALDHERVQFTLVGLFPGFTISAHFSRADPGAKRRKKQLLQQQHVFSLSFSLYFFLSVSFSLCFFLFLINDHSLSFPLPLSFSLSLYLSFIFLFIVFFLFIVMFLFPSLSLICLFLSLSLPLPLLWGPKFQTRNRRILTKTGGISQNWKELVIVEQMVNDG